MASKVIVVVCNIALFVQAAMSQTSCGCSSNTRLGLGLVGNGLSGYGNGLIGNGLIGNGLIGNGNTYVGSGGGFSVTTYSPIAPTGVSVRSENGIEGPVCINGALPVLSVVTFEGDLPTCGQSGVQYGCGNGNVGITSGSGAVNTGAGWSNGAGQAGARLGYGASGLVDARQAGGLNSCGCGV